MKNDFNRIAPFYQKIARIVFGNQLMAAQQLNLKYLTKGVNVLVVGGGDGEILKYLPSDLELSIDYVELSGQMIKLAEEKAHPKDTNFVNSDVLNHQGQYDVIISNFFLDCFQEDSLEAVIEHLKRLLTQGGKLLVTDFALPQSSVDRFLLWSMHRFFRLFSNLEARSLLPIHQRLLDSGFSTEHIQKHNKERIFTAMYQLLD